MNLKPSIFTVELTEVSYDFVKEFCNQQLPEGQRIDYKRDIPPNVGLEEIICALANTDGGVILVGVETDKELNRPTRISGIRLVNGLEERIINKCLSNINPPLVPEVKICEFAVSETGSKDVGVIFIRVSPSYQAPHQITKTNAILVRKDNRNAGADLNTIERLLERRNQVAKSSPYGTEWTYKFVQSEEDHFESLVIFPRFVSNPIIFFNRDTDSWLDQVTHRIGHWNMRKPAPRKLELWTEKDGKVLYFCRIMDDGHLLLQHPTSYKQNYLSIHDSLFFISNALEVARQVYPRFGYYGELIVGFTICGTTNAKPYILIGGSSPYWPQACENKQIFLERQLRIDELNEPKIILESVVREILRSFGLAPKEAAISDIATDFAE